MNQKPIYTKPYEVDGNKLFKTVASGQSTKKILLCNFLPYLTAEKIYDNGAEQNRYFEVEAIAETGEILPKVLLSVSQFEGMNWITENWGSRCNIEAGRSTKEQIRHAIQTTAERITPQIIYTHSGWRKIGGELKFLLKGMDNSCEIFDETLQNYFFPCEIKPEKICSSFELLNSELAPKNILFPMLAFQFLAPLTHLLNLADITPKTVLSLVGRTGSKKSSLTAIFLSHFGNFTLSTLPLTFRDTGNSIVERLFFTKDLPTVIDDFHPTSSGYEEASMLKTFQLIMRAFGDNTGRASLNQNREIRPAKTPRGVGIITAEESPKISESGLARCLEIEISPQDVDMNLLSEWQEKARNSDLGMSMKSYVFWLENQLDSEEKINNFAEEIKILFELFREDLRNKLLQSGTKFHDRIPDSCAFLLVGFEYFLQFISAKNISKSVEKYSTEMFEIVLELAKKQNKFTISKAEFFVQNLAEMIENEVVIIPKKEDFNFGIADCIGFQDEEKFYLNMTSTIKSMRKFCADLGEELPSDARKILKCLDEENFLVQSGSGEKTQSIKIAGNKNIRVAVFEKNRVGNFANSLSC